MRIAEQFNVAFLVFIFERDIIDRKIDDDGCHELVPCKVEERIPEAPWSEIYRLSRLNGISPATKSFNFNLVHSRKY